MSQRTIEIPPPPEGPEEHKYYFIYSEWVQLEEQSVLMTADNPNPQGGIAMRKVGANEAISVSPAVWVVAMTQMRNEATGAPVRPGYVIKMAEPITEQMYRWYKQYEGIMKQLAAASTNGKSTAQSESPAEGGLITSEA